MVTRYHGMEYKMGRLIDHFEIRVSDLEASRTFYAEVLKALGRELMVDRYVHSDEFYLTVGETLSRVHLAFQAQNRTAVETFYAVGLHAGGRDNGPPAERGYHQGYYAAFLLDPDGNNIEAVFHGPSRRSAEAITIELLT